MEPVDDTPKPIPTVMVVHPDGPEYGCVVINEARFDPDLHTIHPDFRREWEARLEAMYARAEAAQAQAKAEAKAAPKMAPPSAPAPEEVDATDSARALAEAHGIDLSGVTGTGQGGRILKRDVEALLPSEGQDG